MPIPVSNPIKKEPNKDTTKTTTPKKGGSKPKSKA